MIKLLIPALILSSVVQASECKLVDNNSIEPNTILGKKLSVFWSNEYTGADLVKKELRTINWKKRVKVSVYDSGFEKDFINLNEDTLVEASYMRRNRRLTAHHGTSVTNIINGNESYGVSELVDYLGLRNVKFASTYNQEFRRYEELDTYPKIISNSYGWSNTKSIQELSFKAKERDILWFLAAGNDHPNKISNIEQDSGAILIGSYAPSGLQSSFSQVSNKVVTLAGGDDYQASIDGKGVHTNFGGTSGATPLVAASIANIAALIPNITYEQVVELIRATNLTSFEQNNRLQFKPGLFNAYKAFHVAKKIAKKCHYHIDSNDTLCVTSELKNRENFNFAHLIDEAPLATTILSKDLSCENRKQDLEILRGHALLIDSPILWERLESVYTNLSYTKNAEFYGNLKTRFELTRIQIRQMEIAAINALKEEKFFESYFRYQGFYTEKYQLELVELLIGENNYSKYWIAHYLSEMKKSLTEDVISKLKSSLEDRSSEVKEYIRKILE
ncbi:putative peptidase [Halobacteriovorax marinus SJ]|uniref:Peptidase n=1 Tax=Halobacteriovorax marinus (strain ATCC BAA-682 / DSM 15412 / SJ) TaxID=862908 RepID=E1X661_HALMS|nr:S8/S53 family peptidase [Halobacteriovorax marinus]CBW27405.1 putative peptidase [Halobacteriovorax marinus SJ]